MTYAEFSGFFWRYKFEKEERNIITVLSDVLLNTCEHGHLSSLEFRMQQYKNLRLYNELNELFKINELGVDDEKPNKVREKIDYFVFDTIEKYFNRDDNIMFEKSKDPLVHKKIKEDIKDLISRIKNDKEYIDSIKEFYNLLNEELGSAIFELIRYDLNLAFKRDIIPFYEILKDKFGNLYNKDVFVKVVTLKSVDEFNLCYNIIHLLQIRNVFDKEKEKVFNMILNMQFNDLYDYYLKLLYENPNMEKIDIKIELISPGVEFTDDYVEYMQTLISSRDRLVSPEELKLKVLRNGNQKFKNYNIMNINALELLESLLTLIKSGTNLSRDDILKKLLFDKEGLEDLIKSKNQGKIGESALLISDAERKLELLKRSFEL